MDFTQEPETQFNYFNYYFLCPTRPKRIEFKIPHPDHIQTISRDLPDQWGDLDGIGSGSNSYSFMFVCSSCIVLHTAQILWGDHIRMPQLLDANLNPIASQMTVQDSEFRDFERELEEDYDE